ncbi:uncharacterized protein LOC143434633 [Arvicanthis niloticus]|uniref:uncharacterized protein LOC143309059 n=1 Tax=Arvicanthis niloticus TaxID=61156 RepID=UPI00402B573B
MFHHATDDGRVPTTQHDSTRRTSAADAEAEPKAQGGRGTSGIAAPGTADRTAQEQTLPGLPRYPPETSACPPLQGHQLRYPLSYPRAPAESTRVAHGCPGVPCTLEPSPNPRLAPAQAPARTWTRSSVPPLVLSALVKESGAHPRCSLPPKPGGAGGRAEPAAAPQSAPPALLRACSEQCAWRSLLTRLGPEAQEDPPKCREMSGGLARDVAPPAGRRRAPGTRRARAGGVGGTRGAVSGLRL